MWGSKAVSPRGGPDREFTRQIDIWLMCSSATKGRQAARQGWGTCNNARRLASAEAMENIRRLILGVKRKRLAGPTPELLDTRDGEPLANGSAGSNFPVGPRNNRKSSSTGVKHAGLSAGYHQTSCNPMLADDGKGSFAGFARRTYRRNGRPGRFVVNVEDGPG